MSCSSAKSKAAGRRRSVQSTTPGMQEVEVKYVTPAGPTQAQWADMIIQEDAEEAVVEIMEDVMNQVMEGCEKIYLKKQVTSFTASWVKSHLTQILEQQFLHRDEGEGPEGAPKTEDSEPTPATPDFWTEGLYPMCMSSLNGSLQKADIGQTRRQAQASTSRQCTVTAQMNRSLKQFKETRRSGAPPCDDFCKMRGPCTLPDIHQKKKQQNKTPHKLVSNKLLPPLTCSEEKRSTEGGNKADCVPKDPNIHRYQLQDYGSLLIHDQSLSPHWIIPQCNISNKNHTKHDNLLVSSSLVSQR